MMAPERIRERQFVADRMMGDVFPFSLSKPGGCFDCESTRGDAVAARLLRVWGRRDEVEWVVAEVRYGTILLVGEKPRCWMPVIEISSVHPSDSREAGDLRGDAKCQTFSTQCS